MLDGIDLEDKENVASVTSVIKAVLDGVKVGPLPIEDVLRRVLSVFSSQQPLKAPSYQQELVKLTIEKQEQPSPTSPNKPAPPPSPTVER